MSLPSIRVDMKPDDVLFSSTELRQIEYIQHVVGYKAAREWGDAIINNRRAENAKNLAIYAAIAGGDCIGYHFYNPISDDFLETVAVPLADSDEEHTFALNQMMIDAHDRYECPISWVPVEREEAVSLLASMRAGV